MKKKYSVKVTCGITQEWVIPASSPENAAAIGETRIGNVLKTFRNSEIVKIDVSDAESGESLVTFNESDGVTRMFKSLLKSALADGSVESHVDGENVHTDDWEAADRDSEPELGK